jgi:shikimate kinase
MKLDRHVVLLGFKHVGKSTIAKRLARLLASPFIDMDLAVEASFHQNMQECAEAQFFSCKDIVDYFGLDVFRDIETEVLAESLLQPPSVIALGGGAVLALENQRLLKDCCLIHITAPKACVYQRIMKQGIPAFFDKTMLPQQAFEQLWQERMTIYQALTPLSVHNDTTVRDACQAIIHLLK